MTSCEELAQLVNAFQGSVANLDHRMDELRTEMTNTNLEVARLTKAIAFIETPKVNEGITKAQLDKTLNPLKDQLTKLGKFSDLKEGGTNGVSAAVVVGMIGAQVNPLKIKLGETTATLGDVRKMAKRLDTLLGNQTETVKVLDKKWREADGRLGGSERMQDRLQKTISKQRHELNQLDKTTKKAVEQSKKGVEALKVANKNKGLIDKVSKVADIAKKAGDGAAKGVKALQPLKPLAPWVGALVNLAGFALTAATFFATLELTGRQLNNLDEVVAKNDTIQLKQGSLIQQLKGRLNTQQQQIDKIKKENLSFDQDFKGLKQTINRTEKEVTKQNGIIQKVRESVDRVANRLKFLLDYLHNLQDYAIRIDQNYSRQTSDLKASLGNTANQLLKTTTTADNALKLASGLKAFGQEITTQIGKLTSNFKELSTSVINQAQAIPLLRGRLGILEGNLTNIRTNITGLEAGNAITRQIAQQALTKPGKPGPQGIPGKNGLNGKDGLDADQAKLRQLQTEIITIGTVATTAAVGISGINLLQNRVGNTERQTTSLQNQLQKQRQELEDKIKSMTCRYSPALDTKIAGNTELIQLKQERTNGLVIRAIAAIETINTAGLAKIIATTNTINTKLGKQLTGGVGGFLEGLWSSLRLGMIFQAISVWITLHNAIMLSSDIVQTLFSGIDSLIQFMGIQNPDKSAINVSEILGKKVEELLKGMMGAANYEAAKVKWNQLNRIYQATTNMLDAVTNMFSSLWNILETTGRYVSKIGNALKRAGAVIDDAYSWMDEQISVRGGRAGKLQNFVKGLEVAQDAASSFSTITGELVNIKENVEQLKTSKKEFDDATNSATGGIGTQEAAKLAESFSATLTNSDILESIPTE